MIPLSLLYAVDHWLHEHLPVVCFNCRRWTIRGQRYYGATGTLIFALCPDCERDVRR